MKCKNKCLSSSALTWIATKSQYILEEQRYNFFKFWIALKKIQIFKKNLELNLKWLITLYKEENAIDVD